MLMIPAIDLLDGRVVRLTQGDYHQVQPYEVDPVTLARQFQEAGATRIHIVDLAGAKQGLPVHTEIIKNIREQVGVEIELGGGIRSLQVAKEWVDAGVNYIILGSLVIQDPPMASLIASTFPGQVIVGLDAHDGEVAISGWESPSGQGIQSVLTGIANWPLDSVIFTDIATDGTLGGPNLDALTHVLSMTAHPVIASGGVGSMIHISQLQALPLKGCIVGKALLSGYLSLADLFQ